MTSRWDEGSERAELRKMIAHYDERAEYYEYEYQVNGMPSQERAWMRNERMADALRDAMNGRDTKRALSDLSFSVMGLDASDPERCAASVRSLQRRVEEGEFR